MNEESVTFKVTFAKDETSNDVRVYFKDGLPANYQQFSSISMTPALISISPSTGSSGGTLITVTGTGFGTDTDGVNLVKASNGEEIC